MQIAATDGIPASVGSGRIAFEANAATFPGVSWPSSVVRSIIRTARSSAKTLASRLIDRLASEAARSSSATASTDPTRGSLGSSGSSKPRGRTGACATRLSVAPGIRAKAALSPGGWLRRFGVPIPGAKAKLSRRSRRLEAEALQRRFVTTPARLHLDAELEIDGMPDNGLDLGPRPPADLPHHRAALADDDLLLRLRLDEQVGLDHLLPELLHFDGDRVGKLVLRQAQRLLAHELGDLHLHRQVGALLLREVQRAFGEQRDQLLP